MAKAIVITPVKNALENTLKTIEAIHNNNVEVQYFVYNDFSDEETKLTLTQKQNELNFKLINLEELTSSPSPNYNIVLEKAQQIAIEEQLPLIVIESDVEIKEDTINQMINFSNNHSDAGMVGAVTVDNLGEINFPYLKFKGTQQEFASTNRSLSFCCTLMTLRFLEQYSFNELDRTKDWYDTIISKKSIALGFKNYILFKSPVLHKAHGSRPWKQLKYTNPLKYYWLKLIKRRDKI